jgi:hypothetical protein
MTKNKNGNLIEFQPLGNFNAGKANHTLYSCVNEIIANFPKEIVLVKNKCKVPISTWKADHEFDNSKPGVYKFIGYLSDEYKALKEKISEIQILVYVH